MPHIAVIQNGTDVARSAWADVISCYQESCRLLSANGEQFDLTFYSDETVAPLLEALDRSEVDCLVFATNALTSEQVARAADRHAGRLRDFLHRGGGLVVLHQWLESLDVVLPEELRPKMTTRTGAEPDDISLSSGARDDSVLHVPSSVMVDRLRDGGHEHGPSWLFFKALDRRSLPEGLTTVLAKDEDQAVLVRTEDHLPERIVLCTMLLDWQHNVGLLANVIRFAAAGPPRRLIWRDPQVSSAELLHRWLCMDDAALVRLVPARGEDLTPVDDWLLRERGSAVEMLVVPPDHLDDAAERPEVLRFLERGGTVVSTDRATRISASRITALVGDYSQRQLASRLYAELRAVTDWETVESAFDARNIIAAIALLELDPANVSPVAVTTAGLRHLAQDACDRLRTPRHREDIASSIALAQIVPMLTPDGPLDTSLVTWMASHPLCRDFDAEFQIRALRAAWERAADHDFLDDLATAMMAREPALVSLAPVIRCLDSVAFLDQLELLASDRPTTSPVLADVVARVLARFPADQAAGWLSVEATADVVRGVVALLRHVPADSDVADRLARHVATGADVLRRALNRHDRTARGVARRARLTHALVEADRAFPIGLQRLATLRWPDGGTSTATEEYVDQALVEHLATVNVRLRNTVADMSADAEVLRTGLRDQRIAATLGRGFATSLPALVITAAAVWVALAIGAESVWGLLANVGSLATILVLLLSLLFSALARVGLLAAPGRSFLDAAEKVAVPVISSLGKLKRS